MDGKESKTRNVIWLKLNQNVHIAIRFKLFAKHRSKKSQFPDMVFETKSFYLSLIYRNLQTHGLNFIRLSARALPSGD